MPDLVPKDFFSSDLNSTFIPSLEVLIKDFGLDREILPSSEDINELWNRLPRQVNRIPKELRNKLIVKMCIASACGLFDGAINYIWNASILSLRERVKRFGLRIVSQVLQRDFEEKDLLSLRDSELLKLCLDINLINNDAYFMLDQCREIRNNYSAAHPADGDISEAEVISFIDRCSRHALSTSDSPSGVDISQFIRALTQDNGLTFDQINHWAEALDRTHDAQRQRLLVMAYGIFCDPKFGESVRQNSIAICIRLKDQINSSVLSDLLNRHNEYRAKGDKDKSNASSNFFEKLELFKHLSEAEKHYKISSATENLMNVHYGVDNYHNEPPFAERLLRISGQFKIPETARNEYVAAVTTCYIGNRYGYSWNAESFYKEMIQNFHPSEIAVMLSLPNDNNANIKELLRHPHCKDRFKAAVGLLNPESIPGKSKREYEIWTRSDDEEE